MLVYIVLLFSVVTMLNCQTGVSMRGFFAQEDMTKAALSRMCNTYVQENATVYDYSGQFTVYKAIKELMSRQPSYIRVSVAYAVRSLVENLLRSKYDLVTETRFLTNGVYSCCLVFQRAVVDSAVMVSYQGYNVSRILAESLSYATYYTVIKDIASLLQWKNTCVFYTDQLVHQSNTLTTVLSEIGIRFWLHSIGTGDTLVKSLSNCYNAMIATDINFMLIANQSSVENILRKINILSRRHGDLAQLGLMSRWFVWGHNICVKCLQSKVQNVSNVSILQTNKQVPTSVCSEVPVYEVLTAYWQREGRQFGRVASWTSLGHMTTYDDIFPNVRAGLNNVTLIVTTKDWAPFTIKTVVGGVAHYKGVCLDLIEEMSRRLNFSFVVVEPPDGQWGLKMLSGNWTGMIAQLANRDVDVMVAAASIQQEREEVMDFVHPFYNDYTSLLLKKPDKKLDKWKRLINPIHWVVVVCIVISLPIVTLSLVYIEKNHPCYWNINRKHRRGLHRFDDCLWYNLAALLNEGGQETPEDQAGRTVVAAWWLFTIVVVASYTSTLTAALTVEKDDLPFETIEEMTEQTDYKWGGTNGSYMFMLFQKSNNGVYKKLWAGVERFLRDDPDLLNSNYHVQMNRVKQGNYVLMNDKSVNLIEVARDCDLAITKQEFLPLNFGIGLQQNSPYKKLFQNQMISIEESGLLELWKTKWWPPMHNCTKLGPAEVKPISLADVQGGYMILGLGIFGSVFTFGLEYLLSHVSSKCRCGLCET